MSTTKPIKDKTDLERIKNYYLDKKEYRNYTLIIIGLNTALRISDILSLTWKDVYHYKKNKFHNHIYLTEKKTGKRTVIALNQSVIEALKILLASDYYQKELPPPEEYIFIGRKNTGMPINRVQAYRIIKEAAQAAGLDEYVSCHSLRKPFGYFAWKQGVPPAMLMDIYNHSSYKITRRYLCIEQEDKDDVFMNIKL